MEPCPIEISTSTSSGMNISFFIVTTLKAGKMCHYSNKDDLGIENGEMMIWCNKVLTRSRLGSRLNMSYHSKTMHKHYATQSHSLRPDYLCHR